MVTSTVQHSLVIDSKKDVIRGRPTGRVSKRDWLDKALEVFVSGGIDAVRIVDLARHLKIAKSGFYWHFRDRAELLEAMKLYWVDEFSHQFIEDTHAFKGPLRERLISLIRAIRAKESGKLDLAFTGWAQTEPSVRDLVSRVRDLRIVFVKELLSATVVNDAELTSRARLFVAYFSWSEVMFESNAGELADEDLNTILDIITGAGLD